MASSGEPFVGMPKARADDRKRREQRKRRWLAEQERRTRERIEKELGNL